MSGGPPHGPEEVHGTAVGVGGRGLLIVGPSGSGKSRLAVEMMALGAALVSDDRVEVLPDDPPRLVAPARWPGLIEVRGLGLLRVPRGDAVPCVAVLDLGWSGEARIPEPSTFTLAGCSVTCLRWGDGRPYAAALMLYLRCNCERR